MAVRKKVDEIYAYEAGQSYALVAKIVDGRGGSDNINVTLDVLEATSLYFAGCRGTDE